MAAEAFDAFRLGDIRPNATKPPRSSGARPRLGVGKLAEQLIVEHADWTYRRIAEEVNARVEGAKASETSVRWYASRMRARGDAVPSRRKKRA